MEAIGNQSRGIFRLGYFHRHPRCHDATCQKGTFLCCNHVASTLCTASASLAGFYHFLFFPFSSWIGSNRYAFPQSAWAFTRRPQRDYGRPVGALFSRGPGRHRHDVDGRAGTQAEGARRHLQGHSHVFGHATTFRFRRGHSATREVHLRFWTRGIEGRTKYLPCSEYQSRARTTNSIWPNIENLGRLNVWMESKT